MSINNIQATKYFDEVRAHFASQAEAGKAIHLRLDIAKKVDGTIFIGIFDDNNSNAIPMVLMLNTVGSGRRWSNECSTTGEVYNIVNMALLAFDKQKEEWKTKEFDFQLKDVTNFLVEFMKQVSDFLR